MKNLKRNQNIIFLSKANIALVVLKNNNILFADEYKVNEDNIQIQLSNLLTNAANFLGFNIKEANLVFEDYDVSTKLINKQFYRVYTQEEITKKIYKDSRLEGNFVNSISFNSLTSNNVKTNVACKALVSKYSVYEQYKKMVNYCHVKTLNCINIASLLNNDENELVLNFVNDKLYACKYSNDNLENCFNLNIDFDLIVSNVANRLNISRDVVAKLYKLANHVAEYEDENFSLYWNYDLKNKSLSTINSNEFVSIWKEELTHQIKAKLEINDWSSTKIITDNVLNNLNKTKFENDLIGLDSLSVEKVLCIMNANKIQTIENHSKYEKVIDDKYQHLIA